MEYQANVNGSRQATLNWDGRSKHASLNGADVMLDIADSENRHSHWLVGHQSYQVEVIHLDHAEKRVSVRVNGVVYEVQIRDAYDALLKSLGMESTSSAKIKQVKAPMPGLVLRIEVAPGQEVEKDTPLLILEAMKMENVIKSPGPGRIKAAPIQQGVAVEKGAVLIEFE
ncbi:MAG: acetyl-CoA carboxylase biotin carboxyl carrier protein subunit [Flavobacteriales bacterium]